MNGKTAKLLSRYALSKGTSVDDIKKQWLSLTADGRFKRRQEILTELQNKK